MKKKEDKNIWYTTIDIDIFATSIIVIVCNDKETIKKDTPEIDRKLGTVNLLTSWADKTLSDNFLCSHTAQAPNGLGDVIVFFNAENPGEVSYETMVHEFHHATYSLCSFRGIDDEETEAYIHEHLFHKMLCKIDDWIDKQKKVSKKPKKKA